mmetsp:Transcript_27246/g.54827  ORF Transcript_27246/g.54827 Transcript_27246/m.54827 type:complete len:201 (+) Transcript_27246:112-714(+)
MTPSKRRRRSTTLKSGRQVPNVHPSSAESLQHFPPICRKSRDVLLQTCLLLIHCLRSVEQARAVLLARRVRCKLSFSGCELPLHRLLAFLELLLHPISLWLLYHPLRLLLLDSAHLEEGLMRIGASWMHDRACCAHRLSVVGRHCLLTRRRACRCSPVVRLCSVSGKLYLHIGPLLDAERAAHLLQRRHTDIEPCGSFCD